jgi:hypothetical protein
MRKMGLALARATIRRFGLAQFMERFAVANLSSALQQLSTLSSAKYILEEFGAAEAFDTQEEVLLFSLEQAKLDGLVLEFGVFEGKT